MCQLWSSSLDGKSERKDDRLREWDMDQLWRGKEDESFRES